MKKIVVIGENTIGIDYADNLFILHRYANRTIKVGEWRKLEGEEIFEILIGTKK